MCCDTKTPNRAKTAAKSKVFADRMIINKGSSMPIQIAPIQNRFLYRPLRIELATFVDAGEWCSLLKSMNVQPRFSKIDPASAHHK